jgi:hypothetical protein
VFYIWKDWVVDGNALQRAEGALVTSLAVVAAQWNVYQRLRAASARYRPFPRTPI